LRKKWKSRRFLQRVKKWLKLQAENDFHKKLQHITTAAVHSTEVQCDRLYGFHANPDKSLTANFNQAIRTRDHRLIQNQPTNLSYHNLCTLQQPPSNVGQLLDLNLKCCVALPTPKPPLATDEIEYNLSRFESLLEKAATDLPKKCKSNLTPTQYKLLQELKGSPEFIILP